MTQIAAIALALLKGEVISIKTAFNQFGCTNAPREISRSIEKKFEVKVSRVPKKFTSRYGKSGIYYQYRLNKSDHNLLGIEKMKEYVKSEFNKQGSAKTDKEKTFYKQIDMFLNT